MRMNNKSALTTLALAVTLAVSSCSGFKGKDAQEKSATNDDYTIVFDNNTLYSDTTLQTRADQNSYGLATEPDNRNKLKRRFYAAIGYGLSTLTPDNSQIPTWHVSEKEDNGGQLTVGGDMNKSFSFELHTADLGSAGLSPRGGISYKMNGASALYYMGKNRNNFNREGFTGYARLGLARMENSPIGDAPYDRAHNTQVLLGAGLEYMTRSGLGLRADYISFDKDAKLAQVGLIYRFGRRDQNDAPVLIVNNTHQSAQAPRTPPIVTAISTAPIIGEDNTIPEEDDCSIHYQDTQQSNSDCDGIEGIIQGVNFYSTSARLTPKARSILNSVADTLQTLDMSHIMVIAHTDNEGSEPYNQNLSVRRAQTVVRYLQHKGIARSTLIPIAYGEKRPIASNDTVEGRALNRRVELRIAR